MMIKVNGIPISRLDPKLPVKEKAGWQGGAGGWMSRSGVLVVWEYFQGIEKSLEKGLMI